MSRRFGEDGAEQHAFEMPKSGFRPVYLEAYDTVIAGIEQRFEQPDFQIYRNLQDIFLNGIHGKGFDEGLGSVADIFKGI